MPATRRGARVAIALGLASLLSSSSFAAPPAGLDALDHAFRFASGIRGDDTDRGRAQEMVVLDYARAGALDEGVRRAEQIVGWRQGTAWAELAARLAEQGRVREARELVDRARAVQRTTAGWQERRIEAWVAGSLAALGELEVARTISAQLASHDNQYAGRASALVAPALAARGDLDQAIQRLRELDGLADVDAAWWRTQGYLGVARQTALDAPRRLDALDRARRSAERIPGWRAAEALVQVAEAQRDLGAAGAARRTLAVVDPFVAALGTDVPVKAWLVSQVAAAWARAGRPSKGRRPLESAENDVAEMAPIDRPGAWGAVASAWMVLGDGPAARRRLERGLSAAESLANARPRALAVVEICRSMALGGLEVDAANRRRLDALFDGLKDPW